jgi:pyruvate formate lyase activating enzyme
MKIGAIVDASTKQIPGMTSMVFLTIGCNLNCAFCNKKHLLRKDAGKEYSLTELLKVISNNFLIQAISISGGEPTLQDDLVPFCKELKELDKYVSINTNGLILDKIKLLKAKNAVDRVVLTLPAPLNRKRYNTVSNTSINPEKIEHSIDILIEQDKIDFEIRTIYVENLLKIQDIQEIIKFLSKKEFSGRFILQQYQYPDGVGEQFKMKYKKPEHFTLIEILKPYLTIDLPFQIYLRDEVSIYSEIHEVFDKIL